MAKRTAQNSHESYPNRVAAEAAEPLPEESAPASPKAPRLTMKALDEKIDVSRSEFTKAIAELRKMLDIARHHISELQRAKQGTTLANARVAAIETEIAGLTARANMLGGDKPTDSALAGAYAQEFERINTRLGDLFGRTSKEVSDLRGEVDTLKGQVAGHEVAITMLNEGQESLHKRVNVLERMRGMRDTFPWIRAGIAVVFGLIAGWIWWAIPFTQSYTQADGTVITVPLEAAESDWAVAGAGIAGFGLAFGIMLLFNRTRRPAEHEVEANPAPTRVQSAKPAPAPAKSEATTPTKVLSGTEGVKSDA